MCVSVSLCMCFSLSLSCIAGYVFECVNESEGTERGLCYVSPRQIQMQLKNHEDS